MAAHDDFAGYVTLTSKHPGNFTLGSDSAPPYLDAQGRVIFQAQVHVQHHLLAESEAQLATERAKNAKLVEQLSAKDYYLKQKDEAIEGAKGLAKLLDKCFRFLAGFPARDLPTKEQRELRDLIHEVRPVLCKALGTAVEEARPASQAAWKRAAVGVFLTANEHGVMTLRTSDGTEFTHTPDKRK